jgi:transcriptional regulator with XRE-family HTH domain
METVYETPVLAAARYTSCSMPKASRLPLAPLPPSDETPGERLARIRKERGFTQKELAEKTGLIQTLVSDYERGKLRLNAGMILRFATALEVSTDDLLQPSGPPPVRKPSRKVLRRLERIEELPQRQQLTLLRTIDTFLENAALKAARR